ncbi:hypothetical protein [Frankia tisae]|uniref:hypothetical protein n=1 Tax=Frankia tisae TaxID=2950104 RepID=UPI0021BF8060|nr:hypothetical protein [Frankia tisae]
MGAPPGRRGPAPGPYDRDGDPPNGDIDSKLGRIRPSGALVLDTRGINREVIGAPVGGLSRNLTTWG